MRRLVLVALVAGAVLAIPTAQAVTAPSLTLTASSLQTRYGEPIHLAGEVVRSYEELGIRNPCRRRGDHVVHENRDGPVVLPGEAAGRAECR